MLKQLRSFALAVAMMLPFMAQAQETLTVYDGTGTNSNVPFHGLYADTYGSAAEVVFPGDQLASMAGGSISSVTFYLSTPATTAWTATFQVYLAEISETTLSGISGPTAATVVYTGAVDATGSTLTINFSTPYDYQGGNLLFGSFVSQAGNWKSAYFYGESQSAITGRSRNSPTASVTAQSFLPKTTFTYTAAAASCAAVKNLAIDPTLTTANSLTFSWTDVDNTSATYNVYRINGTDTTLLQGGLTAMTYTATGLDANTAYTFGVKASCGEGDTSRIRTVSGRTACGVVSAFPWVEDFESYAANTTAIPCMLNEHIEGSGSQVFTVNTTTQSGNSTKKLMLPDMINGTMTKLVLPEMSLNGNYEFIIDVLRNVSGTSYPGEGIRVFASTDGELDGATELGFISRNYTQADGGVVQAESATGWYTYEFPIPITSGTCYIILRGESKYGSSTYMDNFRVALAPTCAKPRGLVAEATSSSITLSWSDTTNNDAAYSILCLQGTDILSYTTTTDTTYTFSALPENTTYNFTLRALCSDTDSSRAVTVSSRTLRSGRKMTAFNLTGNARREAPVMDTLAEPYSINAPVWYTDNVSSDMSLTWTVNTGAAVFIDTAGDGSFTCQVTSYTLKNYLQMNTPTVLRVKAEDRNVYTDYTLTLQTETCVAARNLQVDPERIRINASWACPDTLVTDFHVLISPTQLDAAALDAATPTVVNDRQYTFEGLTRETQYYVYVKSACGTTWLEQAVMTQALGACEEVAIADGTTTNGYVMLRSSYQDASHRSQVIYPASQLTDLVGVTLTSMTFYTTYTSSTNSYGDWTENNFKLSLAVTSAENVSSAWDPTVGTLVFDGSIPTVTSDGKMVFTFTTPFTYTGGNLMVNLLYTDSYGDRYTSGNFRGITSTGASRYVNGSTYMTASGTATNFLPKFTTEVCAPANACPEVTAISADSVTNTSAKIVWTAADADYCVGNQIIVSATEIDAADLDAATAVSLAADAVSYQATGLNPDHDYYVYIKTLCNGSEHPEGTSGWATFQFHTFPTCRVPEIVSVTVTGKHTAQLVINNTGEALGQADNFSYILSTTLLSEADLAAATATANGIDTTVFTLDNLASATTYYIYVQNVCPAESCSSPWSQPDSVLMPVAMPAPINLAAFDQAHNAFSAVWVRDEVNFADETAWRAAAALHGQAATDWVTVETAIAGTQPLQAYNLFTGLLADTAYDIYVCAYDAVTGLTSDTVRLDSIRTAVDPGNPTVVGAGDQSNLYVPVYGNYTDEQQRTQSIYPASMLTDLIGQTITGIEYEVRSLGTASYGGWGNYIFNVSLAVTDSANLANGWDATPTTNVYTGTLQASVADGMKITFNTPFVYNGGNLLVSFELPTDENGYANCAFAGSTVENASRYVYGSSYLTAAGTLINFLPQANFRTANESSCYDVTTAYQTGLTGFTADFAWQPGNQETAWQYVINTSDTLTNAELETLAQNVTTNSVALTDLLRDTNYTFYLRAACSDTEHSRWTKLPFTTPFEHFDVTVTTAVNDAAMGTATGDTVVPDGDTVTLVATPAEGHHFVSWSNGETTDTIRIVATADTTLTATFAINTYTVTTVADATMGSITGTPTDAVEHGAVVTLIALPSEGYHFTGWSNGATTDTIQVTVTSDTTLTATFAINTYTVTATADATMGSVTGVPTVAVDHGTSVTLTATAEAGYHFVSWTDAANNIVSTDNPYTFNVTSDITLTANFEADGPAVMNVTVNYNPAMGNVTGLPDTVYEGDAITLTATAEAGYHFVNWTSRGTVIGTNETLTLTVTSDTILVANFAINTYTVTAHADATMGSVTGVPTDAVEHGTRVTLTATAEAGYHFVNWTNAEGTVVSTSSTYSFFVTADVDVTANFEADIVYITITGVANDDAMGYVLGSGEYEQGATVTLIAQANEGYRFVRWEETGETTPVITVVANENATYTAVFERGVVGIDDIDTENFTIFAAESKVIVRGAEGRQVCLFDVNGRLLNHKVSANETEEFTVTHAGVYLVKVGNAPAKRVVVVR